MGASPRVLTSVNITVPRVIPEVCNLKTANSSIRNEARLLFSGKTSKNKAINPDLHRPLVLLFFFFIAKYDGHSWNTMHCPSAFT